MSYPAPRRLSWRPAAIGLTRSSRRRAPACHSLARTSRKLSLRRGRSHADVCKSRSPPTIVQESRTYGRGIAHRAIQPPPPACCSLSCDLSPAHHALAETGADRQPAWAMVGTVCSGPISTSIGGAASRIEYHNAKTSTAIAVSASTSKRCQN
jgi:hypothetical protein